MSDFNETEPEQCRDELLKRLLKTPPQPRPKRERGKKQGRTPAPTKKFKPV